MEQEKENKEQNKLAVMPVGKLLASLAAPAIAAQIVNLLYNMVDRIYIGHIPGVGALALTGLACFLAIWEVHPRYTANFNSYIIYAAVAGMAAVCKRIPPKIKKTVIMSRAGNVIIAKLCKMTYNLEDIVKMP